ncbi:MAG TPA: hypothetical protein VFF30_10475 [Nitrososphaerales archaeon]|nr:hypothetical protein [Nitrososphaerales archaeon]
MQRPQEQNSQRMTVVCCTVGFPLCLESALLEIFDDDTRQALKLALLPHEAPRISSIRELASMYERFSEAFGSKLGARALHVLSLWSTGKMESLPCQSCPVYQRQMSMR